MTELQRPRHILVIDDEDYLTEIIQAILEDQNFDVTTCNSSTEALKLLEEHPSKFGLILTDYGMPGLQGKALLEKIRSLDSETPLILMTGFVDLDSRELKQLGVNEILSKPMENRKLLETIENYF